MVQVHLTTPRDSQAAETAWLVIEFCQLLAMLLVAWWLVIDPPAWAMRVLEAIRLLLP